MKRFLSLLVLLSLLVVGCSSAEKTVEISADSDWDDVVAAAQGQTVNWYMWGGQDNINAWVTGFVASNVKEKYGVTLNLVPLTDTADAVNKVANEKAAGKNDGGSADLIWINGANFRTMQQGELLFTQWAEKLPNSVANINWSDPSVAFDFGVPVNGSESPYGKAQFVMVYDSAHIPTPPKSMGELIAWIKANPGKFTYPAPPDFTGVAFVMQVCYHATGGHEPFLAEFDQAVFAEKWASCWQLLNEIEPFLWREGETYPESHARHDELFANGEVWMNMAYNPAEASSKVESGTFPETTRSFVFEEGTLANTHYVAIPFNAASKAGAMVVADFLLSVEAQLSKKDVANWGDFPAIDTNRLSAEDRARFESLPVGVATLSDAELAAHRLPELAPAWQDAAKAAWEAEVLQK